MQISAQKHKTFGGPHPLRGELSELPTPLAASRVGVGPPVTGGGKRKMEAEGDKGKKRKVPTPLPPKMWLAKCLNHSTRERHNKPDLNNTNSNNNNNNNNNTEKDNTATIILLL